MFPHRRIEVIGSPEVNDRWAGDRDISVEKQAIEALQKAFFFSPSALDFEENIEEFIKGMEASYKNQEHSSRTPEEWVMYVMPDFFLEQFPTEFCGIAMERVSSEEIKLSCKNEEGEALEETVSINELRRLFRALRQRLQERLSQKGMDALHVVDKEYARGRVMRLHDNKVYRGGRMDYAFDHVAEVVDKLYHLPERSPYLYYPDLVWGVDRFGYQDSRLIRTELPMTTVSEALRAGTISWPHVLLLVADVVRGLLFLKRNGLYLSDLDFSNMGVDLRTGRGMLFDYDGLTEEGDLFVYPAKSTHIPTELVLERDEQGAPLAVMPAVKNEKHAVYELGVSLNRLWRPYFMRSQGRLVLCEPFFKSRQDQEDLYAFIDRMKDDDPLARPVLVEVLERLDAAYRPYLVSLREENMWENLSKNPPDELIERASNASQVAQSSLEETID